ncbi:MAG: hypothetical protein KA297_31995 [Kofleriaceae bacterium]|nr:hypothetical protein [Kofleriaceae bacterium]
MATPRALIGMVVCVAACSFSPAGGAGGGDDPDADSDPSVDAGPRDPDARRVDAVPGQPDATPAQECSARVTGGLVACVEFEDDLGDGSVEDRGPQSMQIPSTGLTPTVRASSPAAQVSATATTFVAQNPAIELAGGFTLAAWVRVDGPLSTGGHGVIDHDLQYAMFVERPASVDQIGCYIHDAGNWYGMSTTLTSAGTWQLLVCTWAPPAAGQPGQVCAHRLAGTSNVVSSCGSHANNLTAGRGGVALGHNNVNGVPSATGRVPGAIDDVWIYDRPLSKAEVCSLASLSSTCLD